MTWQANAPTQDGEKWQGSVTSNTLTYACHLSMRGPRGRRVWVNGTHRTAGAALVCAQDAARKRNNAEG